MAPLGFLLGVLGLSFNVGREIPVPVGGGRGPLMMSGLGPSDAASALPGEEVADQRRDFYFRQVELPRVQASVPLSPRGAWSVAVRMDSTVRTRVAMTDGGVFVGDALIAPGPWRETPLGEGLRPDRMEFTLAFQDAPLVQRADPENFRRHIDEFVFRSPEGFGLSWLTRFAGGVLVLLLVWIAQWTAWTQAAPGLVIAGPLVLFLMSFLEPVGLALALPRLLGFLAFCVALVFVVGRTLKLPAPKIAALSLLGSGMVLVYGFLSFLPNHSPADLDIHIWRTLDLARVPWSYDAWLRYGSHYPTPSQARGAATEALGEGPLIPYPPLPYFLFYAAHKTGLDLHWSINAIEVTGLALLLPLIFAFARGASSATGGLLAAALMGLDLSTIHHLGRAHAPAVVGGALGIAGVLVFGLALPRLHEPGRLRLPALALGVGALGYASTPLFYALFGAALTAWVSVASKTRTLSRPILLALCAGGALALAVYYGHYVPGLIRSGGPSALLSDPFPGRTFFIFHNESRQSLRLWRLGLFVPFLAAIPATAMVIVRCSSTIRAFLLAWLSAWAGVMLLKEPWALPRLLRWAKEDFYVAPSLALLIAIAVARIESRPLRVGLIVVSLTTALFLRARDYGFHADTLRFLR
jgi:hypothetical protein